MAQILSDKLRGSATANISEEKDHFSPAAYGAGKRQEALGNKKMALHLHGGLLLVGQPDKVNGPWRRFVTNVLQLSLKVRARDAWGETALFERASERAVCSCGCGELRRQKHACVL
ncbi:hypothetical protein DPX16_5949 [Anabarilius grahami]|uniref:Uncharacterized protein n=1 Tax=Anabarilius grahami TaxID=495550 RepID=A0A3N0Y338_ANAGA|nr:hypothetical protein DPX16_5949 [Anabarilius grahami]